MLIWSWFLLDLINVYQFVFHFHEFLYWLWTYVKILIIDRKYKYTMRSLFSKSALQICAWSVEPAVLCFVFLLACTWDFRNFDLILQAGIWPAAAGPGGGCIKIHLIQTGYCWGKHTSYVCIASTILSNPCTGLICLVCETKSLFSFLRIHLPEFCFETIFKF